MEVLSTGVVIDKLIDKEVAYQIVVGEDCKYAKIIDETWQLNLFAQVFKLKKSSESKSELVSAIRQNDLGDFHWEWSSIVSGELSKDDYEKVTFFLLVDDNPEGVLHAFFPKESRINDGHSLVYVDRISVAPWNRPKCPKRQFSGIGSILMLFIKEFSVLKGFGGAVGLHALKQAEEFYVYFGMKDLGVDQEYLDLKYFELPHGQDLGAIV
ncbi:hypothetical protein LCL63_002571 [Vibrio fluvialis]|nr:hypothetical protein [Vibrio fluvialis]